MSGRSTRSQQLPLEEELVFSERSRTTNGRPDLIGLYGQLDQEYFNGKLSAAGYTIALGRKMKETSGYTDLPLRIVRISWEIHRLLPQEELIGTILHEMIHVKLFHHRNDVDSFRHTGEFQKEIKRINEIGPYRVVAYHNLPRKVINQLRPYVWRCKSCKYILRLTDSRKPGLKSGHCIKGQKRCAKPSWIKVK
ncbi:DNA-dependent metalloprotease dvc-1-like [Leptopilina heterotoma]|uniref:DNA-dependent metalloprotease dvc-1-like n=1 Tax=Leptopilina heterotoma TaxID=63436 RepID=UPI001CA956BD|nr:DNA-dependent metalloprotease dvc-1-like [Leptopilina heterotoma]